MDFSDETFRLRPSWPSFSWNMQSAHSPLSESMHNGRHGRVFRFDLYLHHDSALIKLTAFIKIRTYAKSGEELWLEEWSNPLEKQIPISSSSSFLASLEHPITSNEEWVSIFSYQEDLLTREAVLFMLIKSPPVSSRGLLLSEVLCLCREVPLFCGRPGRKHR